MADEPTGNRDSQTGKEIVELLRRMVKERGKTAIVVTHDAGMVEAADLRFHIQDGKICSAQ